MLTALRGLFLSNFIDVAIKKKRLRKCRVHKVDKKWLNSQILAGVEGIGCLISQENMELITSKLGSY